MNSRELPHSVLESFVVDSNRVLKIHLAQKATDAYSEENPEATQSGLSFHPDYTHQIYGEKERIFGYKNLKIELFYSCGHLSPYLNIEYESRIDSDPNCEYEADKVEKLLAEFLDHTYLTNREQYIKCLEEEEPFVPYGNIIDTFMIHNRTFEIYTCQMWHEGFKSYLRRMQTFAIFFIDAANYTDDDGRWTFYTLYEKVLEPNVSYIFAGFCSAFTWVYPDKLRPRISQLLILPPFQKLGCGTNLVSAIFRSLYKDKLVKFIYVEEPSDAFLRIRDYVDATNCSTLESYQPAELRKGFNELMFQEANGNFSLTRNQTMRMYELLRMREFPDKIEMIELRNQIRERLAKRASLLSEDASDPEFCDEEMQKEEPAGQCEKSVGSLESHYARIIKRMIKATQA